jgi:hypothetical protein
LTYTICTIYLRFSLAGNKKHECAIFLNQSFKISFILLLLSCVTFNSVLGISQNESLRMNESSGLAFNCQIPSNPFSQTAYHTDSSEKEFIFENEEEVKKGKALSNAYITDWQFSFFAPVRFPDIQSESACPTFSRNILFCIFRI